MKVRCAGDRSTALWDGWSSGPEDCKDKCIEHAGENCGYIEYMHSNHANGNWCHVWSNENQDCSERIYSGTLVAEIWGYVSQSSGNFCCFFFCFLLS